MDETSISDFKRFLENLRRTLASEKIEYRAYQYWILNVVFKARLRNENVIIELDAGMGKRILAYLLAKVFERDRILIISPSRASIWDMALKFNELSGSDEWFGVITGNQPRWLKEKYLREKRVILATPISLARLLERLGEIARFDIIIINEVDRVVRRVLRRYHTETTYNTANIRYIEDVLGGSKEEQASKEYILIYPWSILKKFLPEDACWIGMSGTLRDEHYIIDNGNRVVVQKELDTIAQVLFPRRKLVIVTMDMLIERTDIGDHISKNLTVIQPIPVIDENIKLLANAISMEIDKVLDEIHKYNRRLYPEETTPLETKEKIMKTVSILPDTNPLKIKFLRLALVRRHLFAGVPESYTRLLAKPMFRRILREFAGVELESVLPKIPAKIERIIEIVQDWLSREKSVIILTSFIRTASRIASVLRDRGVDNILILTGRVPNKKWVIEKFKKTHPAVLILTPVAERDLDFPEASLVIVHDVISTVKSMYQRIKRARRSFVIILYYKDTYEEKKVKILLARIARRYPWSIRIRGG